MDLKSDGITLLILGTIVCVFLFWALITGVGKIMKASDRPGIFNSQKMQEEQSQKIGEVKDKQKKLMEERKQRIRDMQRMR